MVLWRAGRAHAVSWRVDRKPARGAGGSGAGEGEGEGEGVRGGAQRLAFAAVGRERG